MSNSTCEGRKVSVPIQSSKAAESMALTKTLLHSCTQEEVTELIELTLCLTLQLRDVYEFLHAVYSYYACALGADSAHIEHVMKIFIFGT